MLRVAICDDDEVLCHLLEDKVKKLDAVNGSTISTEVFFDGESLCDYMKQGNYFDIIFLDIEMQKMNGVLAGREIRNAIQDDDVQIVYISAMESYAMELFEVRPLHFLIKPIRDEDLQKVLVQACRLLHKGSNLFQYQVNRKYYSVAIKKIQYFEIDNRQIKIHMKDKTISYYGKMSEVIEKVQGHRFLQINRSQLVNYHAIEVYHPDKIWLSSGEMLQIGYSRQKEVQMQMAIYAKEDMV